MDQYYYLLNEFLMSDSVSETWNTNFGAINWIFKKYSFDGSLSFDKIPLFTDVVNAKLTTNDVSITYDEKFNCIYFTNKNIASAPGHIYGQYKRIHGKKKLIISTSRY